MRDDGLIGLPSIEVNSLNDSNIRNIPTLRSVDVSLTQADLGKEFTYQLFVSNREGTASSKLVKYLFAIEPQNPSKAPLIIDYNSTECYVQYIFSDSIYGSEILSFNLQYRNSIDNRWVDISGQ